MLLLFIINQHKVTSISNFIYLFAKIRKWIHLCLLQILLLYDVNILLNFFIPNPYLVLQKWCRHCKTGNRTTANCCVVFYGVKSDCIGNKRSNCFFHQQKMSSDKDWHKNDTTETESILQISNKNKKKFFHILTFEYLRRQGIYWLSSPVQMPIWKYVVEVMN